MGMIDYLYAVFLAMLLSALYMLKRIQKNAIIGEMADDEKIYLNRPMKIEYQEDRVDY